MRLRIRAATVAALALFAGFLFAGTIGAARADTLQLATGNVTNFGKADARASVFQTAIYRAFEGRSLAPDILLVQKVRGYGFARVDVRLSQTVSVEGIPVARAHGFNARETITRLSRITRLKR